MSNNASFNPRDYSLAIKNRGHEKKPWCWEICMAGKNKALKRSEFFVSMSEATRAGKVALAEFLIKSAA